jgi:hypothetical protein
MVSGLGFRIGSGRRAASGERRAEAFATAARAVSGVRLWRVATRRQRLPGEGKEQDTWCGGASSRFVPSLGYLFVGPFMDRARPI